MPAEFIDLPVTIHTFGESSPDGHSHVRYARPADRRSRPGHILLDDDEAGELLNAAAAWCTGLHPKIWSSRAPDGDSLLQRIATRPLSESNCLDRPVRLDLSGVAPPRRVRCKSAGVLLHGPFLQKPLGP
jgi:hypothetical protein